MSGFACYLPNEAMLHLHGNKISEFLQGQLSCDTRKLDETRGIMGAFCNVKGRVLSDLTVLKINDSHTVLRLHRSLAAPVAETLQRYAQFSRIRVEVDTRDDAIVGHYYRNTSSSADDDTRGKASATFTGEPLATSIEGGIVSLTRGPHHREVISIDLESPANLPGVTTGAPGGDPKHWAMEIIASGHYALELEDSEAFTPQVLNYDLTGLVAFDKGCYTGQEIIARLHYKGRSKKRLHRYTLGDTLATPDRDTPIVTSKGENAGRCLRIFQAPQMRTLIAAEVAREYLNADMFLPTGEPLHSVSFDYPATV